MIVIGALGVVYVVVVVLVAVVSAALFLVVGLSYVIVVFVNASRFPLRPLADQRLEAARQQLEAWKPPPQSSWRRLGASKTSPGELLESS